MPINASNSFIPIQEYLNGNSGSSHFFDDLDRLINFKVIAESSTQPNSSPSINNRSRKRNEPLFKSVNNVYSINNIKSKQANKPTVSMFQNRSQFYQQPKLNPNQTDQKTNGQLNGISNGIASKLTPYSSSSNVSSTSSIPYSNTATATNENQSNPVNKLKNPELKATSTFKSHLAIPQYVSRQSLSLDKGSQNHSPVITNSSSANNSSFNNTTPSLEQQQTENSCTNHSGK